VDLHEFELRYRAFSGLNNKFILDRNQDAILDLVKVSSRGQLTKKIQELSPTELRGITIETYTEYKTLFLTEHGSQKINTHTLQDYIERLEYELKVIKEMGFNTYFLIVSDFCLRAKQNTILVGPGRWSGAGSLLARLIRITDVDPLPYWLIFERFLNPARVSMPDFDIDFEDTQRDRVIRYVQEKYGQDKVSAIGTYMQLATRAAFKDAARAVGVAYDRANLFSALIPAKQSLAEALEKKDENIDLVSMYENEDKIRQAADLSSQLSGNMRQLGVHACGIVITPSPVMDYTAIQYVPNSDMQVSQYDGPTLEYIGLLKMDFLGLRNLSVIKNCIKIIKKRYDKKNEELPSIFKQFFIDTSFQPDIDDTVTYEKVFQTWDTTGIFQFEWLGITRFLIQLKANNINDLVAMSALYRPGPMEFIPSYIRRKHGQEQVEYMSSDLRQILLTKYDKHVVDEETRKLSEDLTPILQVTYWIPVYQEQLMSLVQAMAWFSLAEADLLRRWVGKKKKEIIEQLKQEFMDRGEQYKQYKPETTQRVYEKMIEPAASYSFNKSHSVCYALIAYQTAYLKAHYPIPFYAALIRSVEEHTDTLSIFIYETQKHGIAVKNPDINESYNHVAAIQDYIRLGFVCVKWVGYDVWETIQEERKKNGPFKDMEDFLDRCSNIVNKKSMESLIKAGAFDAFGDRSVLLHNLKTILERSKNAKTLDQGLFGSTETAKLTLETTQSANLMDKLFMEQDVLKAFVSGHPLDGLYAYIKKYNFISTLQALAPEQNAGFIIIGFIKNISRAKKKGFFVEIEDLSGSTEFFIKDVVNLKKFDIVIIHGFKSRGRSIDKIIKTSRENLIEHATKSGKYDESLTATQVKKMRNQENPINNTQDTAQLTQEAHIPDEFTNQELSHTTEQDLYKPENDVEPIKQHIEPDNITLAEEKKDEKINNLVFSLPSNAAKIQKLLMLLKNHPGNTSITIDKKTYYIDSNILTEIQELLMTS
jgi:DNA polymerase III subunit alpha